MYESEGERCPVARGLWLRRTGAVVIVASRHGSRAGAGASGESREPLRLDCFAFGHMGAIHIGATTDVYRVNCYLLSDSHWAVSPILVPNKSQVNAMSVPDEKKWCS